jgi:hypothetical protein
LNAPTRFASTPLNMVFAAVHQSVRDSAFAAPKREACRCRRNLRLDRVGEFALPIYRMLSM